MMKYGQRNNMKKIVTFLGALIAASSLNAQSELVFVDQDGTEAGTLVNFDENIYEGAWSKFAVLRRGEYFMRINLETGEISPSTFFYNSLDCSGTPYVVFDRGGNTRGGVIVYTRNLDSPILGLVEWYPEIQTNSFFSAHHLGGTSECGNYSKRVDGVPVTIVAPADYGVSKIPEVKPGTTGLGFKGPLVPKIKQSEVIFCNGLENCPVQ
jgi:hypothetical protein